VLSTKQVRSTQTVSLSTDTYADFVLFSPLKSDQNFVVMDIVEEGQILKHISLNASISIDKTDNSELLSNKNHISNKLGIEDYCYRHNRASLSVMLQSSLIMNQKFTQFFKQFHMI
jgi:hypothetical protein